MNTRLRRVKTYLKENALDAMYLASYESYRYYSGFSGSNGHLVITSNQNLLVTDGRYLQQSAEQAPDFQVVDQRRSLFDALSDILKEQNVRRVGYETMKLTDYTVRMLREACPGVEWVPQENFGLYSRMRKDAEEIARIEKAVEIADRALEELAGCLAPGMTERQAAAELEYRMASHGSERPAFETISASGPRGALPHGAPTDRVIQEGELLTLDFGACYQGYLSDITRTLWFGEPPAELVRIWNVVLEAQQAAEQAVRPGICAGELDEIHRRVIAGHGLEAYIAHSLGHGVGLEIHEEPRIGSSSTTVLEPGMIITIEPGLYIPELGGVRIEDMMLVTQTGGRVLTQSPHLIRIPVSGE